MFEVLVGLDAAVLRTLVVQGPCGVKEGHVAVPARAEVDFLQLQLVGGVQVLLRVPQYSAIQRLTCGGQQRNVLFSVLIKHTLHFKINQSIKKIKIQCECFICFITICWDTIRL